MTSLGSLITLSIRFRCTRTIKSAGLIIISCRSQSTRDSGTMARNSAEAKSSGRTAHSTKEIGIMTSPMEKEDSSTLTAMSMRETGGTTKQMEPATTSTTTEQNTLANESMIFNKGMEKKPGLMELATKATTQMDKRLARGSSHGTTAPSMKATSTIIRLTVGGSITGPMEERSMGSGWRIRCMGKVRIPGKTEESTWVTM